ncbi:MAG: MAPEG family protein [Polyangiales bacterium]
MTSPTRHDHERPRAQVYLGARVAYVAIYAAGIPYLRTMIWTAAMIGLAMVLSPLL